MVEIEQEELERLRNIEKEHTTLKEQHNTLKNEHNTLKDDYIALSKGQRDKGGVDKTDTFDEYCKQRFGK